MQTNTIIIGSGAAGLSAAIIMAAHGHKVTLLEAGPQLAPLLRGFSRQGLHFDTGFHYSGGLGENGLLKVYLNFLGLWNKLSFQPMRQDCCELFRFYRQAAGGSHYTHDVAMPWGKQAIVDSLEKDFPGSKAFVGNFLDTLDEMSRHSSFTNLEKITENFAAFNVPDNSPLNDLLDASLPQALRVALAGRCELFGTPPHFTGLSDFAMVSAPMLHSVHMLHGGGLTLAGAFIERLKELNVNWHCSCPVVGIEVQADSGAKNGRRVRGVRLANGDTINCDNCFYTGHPKALAGLLPPAALRPSFVKHLAELPEGQAAFIVFGSTQSDFLDGRVVHLYTEQALAEYMDTEYFIPQSLCISATSPPESAKDGKKRSVSVAVPLPPDWEKMLNQAPEKYADWKATTAERITRSVRSMCPELADFTPIAAATPSTMKKWVYGGTGSVYGIQHSKSELPLAPRTRIDGLVMAGQNITLPGVLGVIISAVVASGLLLGYPLVLGELQECAKIKS